VLVDDSVGAQAATDLEYLDRRLRVLAEDTPLVVGDRVTERHEAGLNVEDRASGIA
jgi:hypothetical protein